ncbi:MAG: energy-coupling factor ABC transporter ATP-binding protein [Pseudomonadota bacterium]
MSAVVYSFTGIEATINSHVLFHIDHLEIKHGAFTLLRGENGVGKSTLLKSLAGLSPLNVQRVLHNGQPLTINQHKAHFRRSTIYLHQQPYLFDTDVASNLAYGLKRRKIKIDDINHRVNQGLEWSGLAHLRHRHARALSGGERQRVALLRAYVLRPQVLYLDEPTVGMDKESRALSLELIGRLCDEGISVFMTSHEHFDEFSMFEEILFLRDGGLYREPAVSASQI